MAVVDILAAFGYKWAENGTVEPLDDLQWKRGWDFIGSTPPSVEQFNKVHQIADEKSNYLFRQINGVLVSAGIPANVADDGTLARAIVGGAMRHCSVAGTANALSLATLDPATMVVGNGTLLTFYPTNGNTGPVTISVNGAAARPLLGQAQKPLQGGEVAAGGKAVIAWLAAVNSFILVSCSGGSIQAPLAWKDDHLVRLSQVGRRMALVQTSSNFVVPDGVYTLDVSVWGGGGGGGGVGSAGQGAGGGGGGGLARTALSVVPGQSFAVVVGALGTAGGNGGPGGAGGASSFGPALTASGGTGGQPTGLGGSGGVGSGGLLSVAGQAGSSGTTNSGGAGGGTAFGSHGGGSGVGTGANGVFPGGGGAGRGSAGAGPGAPGAVGGVLILY